MNNAKKKAMEAYPKDMQNLIKSDHSTELVDVNTRNRAIYLEGYEQAKKDILEDLPHWKPTRLPNCENVIGINSDFITYKGYHINYKQLFDKLLKDKRNDTRRNE